MRGFRVFLSGLLLCALFLIASPSYAAMEFCPSHKTQTKLFSKRAKTVFQTASLDAINTALGNAGQEMGTVLAFVEYSAEGSLSVTTKYGFSIISAGDNTFCVKLDKVDAYFYARPRIVMPTDFKKGSCEYNFILKHEKRHLQELYDFHEQNTEKYAAYLGQISRSLPVPKPVDEENIEVVKEHIADYFDAKFGALVEKSLIELQERQRKIDSPEEYQANHRRFAQCQQGRKQEKEKNPPKTFDDPLSGFDPRELPFGRK